MELTKTNKIYKLFVELCLDLVFPQKCVSCDKYGGVICYDCLCKINKIQTAVCFGCGKISKDGRVCSSCKRKMPEVRAIISCVRYDSVQIKDLIHNLKYAGIMSIADILGEFAVEKVRNIKDYSDCVIVPVPTHKKRLSKRGYNQAELIARYVSKRLSLPGGSVLEKIAETKPQVSLSREMRLTNIRGSIACADPEFIMGKKVLLIDDISTTGATISECARILKMNGAREVLGVVIAHA